MTVTTFQSRNYHLIILFLKLELIKINDKVLLENVLLISKFINSLPQSSTTGSLFALKQHYYLTGTTSPILIH